MFAGGRASGGEELLPCTLCCRASERLMEASGSSVWSWYARRAVASDSSSMGLDIVAGVWWKMGILSDVVGRGLSCIW